MTAAGLAACEAFSAPKSQPEPMMDPTLANSRPTIPTWRRGRCHRRVPGWLWSWEVLQTETGATAVAPVPVPGVGRPNVPTSPGRSGDAAPSPVPRRARRDRRSRRRSRRARGSARAPWRDRAAVGPHAADDRTVAEQAVDALALVGEVDGQRLARPDDVGRPADGHGHWCRRRPPRDGSALGQRDEDARPRQHRRNPRLSQVAGSRGSKLNVPSWSRIPPKPKTRALHTPPVEATQPVDGVAVQAGQVDVERLVEVVQGRVVVADLGPITDWTTADSVESPVVIGSVLEVGALLLEREPVALQEQRQHHVGLFEHLEAVDHQRVVVHQQRPQLVGGLGQSHTPRSRK